MSNDMLLLMSVLHREGSRMELLSLVKEETKVKSEKEEGRENTERDTKLSQPVYVC